MTAPREFRHDFISRLGWALILILGFASGCVEETTRPQEQDDELVLPALTSPENVIAAMQIIYNEKHSVESRRVGYASLLDTAFVFHFQPADIDAGLPPSWGLEDELAAHAGIFGGQTANRVYSIELRVIHDPADDLSPPEVGREGWQEIFATNVYLRLMFNPEDGLEVNGGQAEFKFPPAKNGQFKIADWADLPRPGLVRSASVENQTWGTIKALYNPDL
jgi:hypothetical protein